MFRRDRADDEVTREINAHLALLEDDYRRRGMTADEARLAARRALGSVAHAKDLHRDARDVRVDRTTCAATSRTAFARCAARQDSARLP